MLASEVALAFPALTLEEDFYTVVPSAKHLHHERLYQMRKCLGSELVDSAGQRFLIVALVGEKRIGPRWKAWFEGKILRPALYHFDLELKPLPPLSFSELHRRVSAIEAEGEAYHVMEGGPPDSPEAKTKLAACRSIEDIIAFNPGLWVTGEPPIQT